MVNSDYDESWNGGPDWQPPSPAPQDGDAAFEDAYKSASPHYRHDKAAAHYFWNVATARALAREAALREVVEDALLVLDPNEETMWAKSARAALARTEAQG